MALALGGGHWALGTGRYEVLVANSRQWAPLALETAGH